MKPPINPSAAEPQDIDTKVMTGERDIIFPIIRLGTDSVRMAIRAHAIS